MHTRFVILSMVRKSNLVYSRSEALYSWIPSNFNRLCPELITFPFVIRYTLVFYVS